jgi:release factor glutamine methyltransferase
MTIGAWLTTSSKTLELAGIESARLDAQVLLSDELQVDKSTILAYPERKLQSSELENLNTKIAQRTQHVPLAYLLGKVEFYGREFIVTSHVLVPRPESESMIALLLKDFARKAPITVVDVGTGSGCIAITAKLEMPDSTVYATDIEHSCLEVAKTNAERLNATIMVLQGDLLEPMFRNEGITKDTILLANLPYVPLDHPINTAAAHEPKLALFSGHDGLDHYRALFAQIYMFALYPDWVITESLVSQHIPLAKLAAKHGYVLETTDGLAQLYRHDTIK